MNRSWIQGMTTGTLLLLGISAPLRAAEVDANSGPSIEGTWRWTFTMPDGASSRPKLVLEFEDGQLTGTTSFRPGNDVTITNAGLDGNQLRFQVVRRRAAREIVTTYWGTWTGKFIRGKVQSNWDGETHVYDWEAQRAHEGAEGLWKWTTSVRGRRVQARVKLDQDGELLTGTVPGSGRGVRRIRISHGSVKNGEIYFEIERGTGANKILTIYKGKQSGDTVKGTIETIVAGRKLESVWEAHRAE